jgi:hypothetical protein
VIPANRQRNLLQSALYVAIAGVLAAVLLERLLTYAEAAEKAAMEVTISNLQGALYSKLAYHALRGEAASIESLSRQSPFAVAGARAANYLGEFDGAPPVSDRSGKWYFDRLRGELVYRPNLARHFSSGAAGEEPEPVVRLRMDLKAGGGTTYHAVLLRPVVPYRWEPFP